MSQNYGVLRVVRVRPPAGAATNTQGKSPTGWLPEEGLVHVLTRYETTIGRALNNDIVLMDPTVSREHARLVLDQDGWHLINLTAQNIVRVNGRPVPCGGSLPVHPQDIVVLGSTMLQLIAPLPNKQDEPGPIDVSSPADVSHMETHPLKLLAQSADQPALADNITIERGRQSTIDGNDGQKASPSSPAPAHPLRPSWQASPQLPISSTRHNGQRHLAQRDFLQVPALPAQPDPELVAQPWDEEEESVLGAGVTMQFALPQRMGLRTRWLIAGVGVAILFISATITIVLNSVIGLSALAENGISSVMVALTIPLVPAIGINLLVNFMDRYEREPWFLRLAAFLWGAIIAIPPAFFVEQNVDNLIQNLLGPNTSDVLRSALGGLNAGVTEESVKGLGLLLLFVILRDEFDNVTDGIVYAALIGAGFAFVENFRYFATNFRDTLVFLIVGRVILGWLGHSTFTACFGAALGYIRHTRVRWKQILIPLLGYLIAVGLHSFYDFVDIQAGAAISAAPNDANVALFSLIAIIGDYIPPFLAQVGLLYILVKGLAHEAAVIREFLAVEVSNGIVMVNEYAILQNSFQRTREERRVLRRSGIRQWLRLKALYQTEIGLAFRKWHVHMGDKPKLGYRQPEDAYRERIRRLRHELRAADMKAQHKYS
jgi:RsiW-degrading membrane proteinase PrsW (M82 family)